MGKGKSCLALSKIQLRPLGVLYQHIWKRRPTRHITMLARTTYILVQFCANQGHKLTLMPALFVVMVLWCYENSTESKLHLSKLIWSVNFREYEVSDYLCSANNRISSTTIFNTLTEKNIIHISKQWHENLPYPVMNAGWNFVSFFISFATHSGQMSDYSISSFNFQDQISI